MLYLIGLGLAKGDMPYRAKEVLKRAELFAESYTSFIGDEYIEEIEKEAGKEIKRLERSDLEEKASEIVGKARDRDIAVLTGGDPLIATTHKILFIEAKKRGVRTEVMHAGSIITAAIGESGLDFYRFGQVITIPEWSEKYKPLSFYEVIDRNLSNGQHSLLLLDYSGVKGGSMSIRAALEEIEAAEAHYRKGIISRGTSIIVMKDVSHGNAERLYCSLEEAKEKDLGPGPALIIIPSKISDVEKEVMDSMYPR